MLFASNLSDVHLRLRLSARVVYRMFMLELFGTWIWFCCRNKATKPLLYYEYAESCRFCFLVLVEDPGVLGIRNMFVGGRA